MIYETVFWTLPVLTLTLLLGWNALLEFLWKRRGNVQDSIAPCQFIHIEMLKAANLQKHNKISYAKVFKQINNIDVFFSYVSLTFNYTSFTDIYNNYLYNSEKIVIIFFWSNGQFLEELYLKDIQKIICPK